MNLEEMTIEQIEQFKKEADLKIVEKKKEICDKMKDEIFKHKYYHNVDNKDCIIFPTKIDFKNMDVVYICFSEYFYNTERISIEQFDLEFKPTDGYDFTVNRLFDKIKGYFPCYEKEIKELEEGKEALDNKCMNLETELHNCKHKVEDFKESIKEFENMSLAEFKELKKGTLR